MAKLRAPVGWNIEQASKEFGLDRDTLSARLIRSEEVADDDGLFTTRQICAAVFGDLEREKIKLTQAQEKKLTLENRARAGELIEVAKAIEIAQRFTFACRQIIMLSKLSDTEKDALLAELRSLRDVDWTKVDAYAESTVET